MSDMELKSSQDLSLEVGQMLLPLSYSSSGIGAEDIDVQWHLEDLGSNPGWISVLSLSYNINSANSIPPFMQPYFPLF